MHEGVFAMLQNMDGVGQSLLRDILFWLRFRRCRARETIWQSLAAENKKIWDDHPVVGKFGDFTYATSVVDRRDWVSLSQPTSHQRSLVDTPNELEQWLCGFADAGVDAFDLSQARYDDPVFPEMAPDLSLAGWAKKLTGVTSIAVGSIGLSTDTYSSFAGETAYARPVDDVRARLARGDFDLVAVGRPLLRDPAWLRKIESDREDDLCDVAPVDLESLY